MVLGPAAALGTSLSWGIGDFAGGLAAKRMHVFVVGAIAQASGLVGVTLIALFVGDPIPSTRDLLWGAAAGIAGAVGVTSLYAALSLGRMGVAAPMAGVLGATLPVAYTWVVGGVPGVLGLAGVGLALGGIVLVSTTKAERPPARVLVLTLFAGLGFAGFLLLMGLSTQTSFIWTLVAARTGSTLGLALLVLATRPGLGKPSWAILVAAAGDTIGNAFFLVASGLTRLDIAVVLSSLFPIATVALARIYLREKLTRAQAIGALLMIVAIPLVSMEA